MMKAPEILPKEIEQAKTLTKDVAIHPLECVCLDDPKYEVALKYVFQNSFLCPDRKTAQILNNSKNWRYCTICIDGEKWDPSGTISGGSKAGMVNLLLEAKQMRQLINRINECTKKLDFLKKTVLAPMEAKKQKFGLLEKSINDYERRILGLRGDIDMRELQDEGRLAKAVSEREEMSGLESELKLRKSDLEKQRKPMRKMLEELVGNRDIHMEKFHSEKVKLKQKVTKVQELHKDLCTRMSQVRVKWTEMKSSVTESAEQLEAWNQEIAHLEENDIKEKNEMIDRESAKIATLNEGLSKLTAEASNISHRIEAVVLELRQINDNIEEETQYIQRTEQEVKDLKLQAEGITKNWQHLEEEMKRQIITDQDLLDAARSEVGDLTLEALKSLIESSIKERAKLQMSIDKRALELLVQAEKDFEALSRDKERVEQERSSVIDFIENLDIQKKKKLESSLVKVDSFLNQLFSCLLPGASAHISALSSNLQEGLEMSVSLGRTKKQSLTELSGGQKSLLALSLVLAMLKLNPAPFYILDEVDAALDLSHTEHLGEMIKRFFSESQFIIVSHKDNLYKSADVLFRTSCIDGISSITKV
eukprot:Gregarina_sp_Poly_1__4353@NODE_2358_length_2242_cov_76_642759_g1187_i1_p1_GENE_NODE_2358_length_2242_cov_76_642759_g1187_i1NODE_2358_length_2242_cov_76_642759_g1187_i1_p1_ORF_typecomplete_len665_score140_79SMC_N/PF02463_19/2_7e42AAA_21/PF13304_6/6_6e09AAA_15/PF13175_6/1_8e06SMC_hinge/PF06470_13/6_5e08AAA_13/PF13166_6/2_3AAA_13/PF13166_6/0_011AAA_13/PF13166_6/0_0029DUF3584/PF12128_8/0_0025SbcCD_C/PF13558_6/2_5e02SbcCD_C/PF13558_6/0_12Spc7/PF08317_11/11Spc7/PF08317_11/0_0059Spc7/PF08317_11/1_6e03M